jgi:hypothetical protein
MNFKQWLNENNKPPTDSEFTNFPYFSSLNAKHIKPNTKIYRGLKLPKEARKKNIRSILIDGTQFKKNKNQSDPWTLDFPVAERFTKGAALSPEGYSLGLENTIPVIIEAELDGPNKELIDWPYWGKTIAGIGVSKGNVNSYWNPYAAGKVKIEDSHIENEIPILHSAYPTLKLTAVYTKDPNTSEWIKNTNPKALG